MELGGQKPTQQTKTMTRNTWKNPGKPSRLLETVTVTEPTAYTFEITLLTEDTRELVKTKARKSMTTMLGGISGHIGPALIGLYRDRQKRMPDILTIPAVSGNKGKALMPGDRYHLPIENPEIRKFIDEIKIELDLTRAGVIHAVLIMSMERTQAEQARTETIH